MIDVRPFASLGKFKNDWLDTNYHFSFSDYFDPKRTQWGALRVWNDDLIKAGTGFGRHGHQDMEIITYVRTGAISHKDSLGNSGKTRAGDVQVMSAGTGILHEEWNQESEDTTLFQIWVMPNARGGKPRWDAAEFPGGERSGKLEVLASGRPGRQALEIRADAELLAGTLEAGDEITYQPESGRHLYLVPSTGKITVNGQTLNARDGAAIKDEATLTIKAVEAAEIILVDSV